MTALILDHLWQSTLILCLAALLTLLLRRNSAAARYWLWFAASVKFLVPLALFTALSSRWITVATVPVLSAPASELGQRLSEPFVRAPSLSDATAANPLAPAGAHVSTVLLLVWSLGSAAVLLSWLIRWRRLQRAVSSATALSLDAPIPVRESSTSMEPGLVGIWKPVILLPAALAERLGPAEIRSVLAHELCHYRRRDNLTAAMHRLVEALFWFYPPIWWLGSRLIAERELACDESVLAAGNDAEVYADSILKVCRFFRQSTTAGALGVSGGALSRRVEEIMNARGTLPVGRAKGFLVAVSMAGVLLGLVLFGGLSAPTSRAQASSFAVLTAVTPVQDAELLAEQDQPQKEVPFNPADFDKFVGYYKSNSPGSLVAFTRVYRNGDHFYAQSTARPVAEIFPESPTEFFLTVVAAQWSFVAGPDGQVSEAIFHRGGYLQPWFKSSQTAYDAFESKLQQRIRENKPGPGTEVAVGRQIAEVERTGHLLYGEMDEPLATVVLKQEKRERAEFQNRGAFKSIRLLKVLPNGADDYIATFAHARTEVVVGLSGDGKIAGIRFSDLP